MAKVNLEELVGGGLQEVFAKAMEEVVENMQNPNTPYKNKREIAIKLKFEQNEDRDDAAVDISVTTKLAPVKPMVTRMAIGKVKNRKSVCAGVWKYHAWTDGI